MSGRNKFKRNKGIINFFVKLVRVLGVKINLKLLTFFRNTSGTKGLLIRYVLVSNLAKKTGENVSIHPGVFLLNLKNIELGDNISIHPMCYIEGGGGIVIGNDVSIAHASTLISTNHTWDEPLIPIKYNKITLQKIIINDDVWIGCGVRILSGIRIGYRSVIAAGAVVNKNVDSKTIVGGIPAKLLKKI